MKWPVWINLFLAIWISHARASEEKFSQTVLPEDFGTLGLSKLSPDELSRLDAKIEAYKSGALTAARREAEAALKAKQVAEVQAARSEANAKAAELAAQKAEQLEESRRNQAANALVPPKTAENVSIESTIPGKFRGWQGRQVFVLANGQRWQVSNNENYYAPAVDNVKVRITRASVTGYWLTFPDLDARVRVVPVEGTGK